MKLRTIFPGLVALVLLAGVAQAADFWAIPKDHAGPPIYARHLAWVGYQQTVAFIFYRSPDCVPKDFNLLTFYDFGLLDPPPGAEILMEGFMVWDMEKTWAPTQEVLRGVKGVPVPIWFVSVADMNAAIRRDLNGDGQPDYVVTVGDLEAMQSLQKGSADLYHEVLQPTDGHNVPKLNIVTSGSLEGGGTFYMMYESVSTTDFLTETILRFDLTLKK